MSLDDNTHKAKHGTLSFCAVPLLSTCTQRVGCCLGPWSCPSLSWLVFDPQLFLAFGRQQWLHENRSEGCSDAALAMAASRGHMSTVEWFYGNGFRGDISKAIDEAQAEGHVEVCRFLEHEVGGGEGEVVRVVFVEFLLRRAEEGRWFCVFFVTMPGVLCVHRSVAAMIASSSIWFPPEGGGLGLGCDYRGWRVYWCMFSREVGGCFTCVHAVVVPLTLLFASPLLNQPIHQSLQVQ